MTAEVETHTPINQNHANWAISETNECVYIHKYIYISEEGDINNFTHPYMGNPVHHPPYTDLKKPVQPCPQKAQTLRAAWQQSLSALEPTWSIGELLVKCLR
jgi:hypothetical protein